MSRTPQDPQAPEGRHGPAPTSGAPSPADLTAWTLVQAAHLAGRRFNEVFASQGLTAHQFGILVQLSREPGLSQAALARHILVTPQSVGDILTSMQDTGLVRRTPAPHRGGATSVELTLQGKEALARTFPLVGAINTPQALGLSEVDAHTLNTLLHRVHDHLDNRPFIPVPGGI